MEPHIKDFMQTLTEAGWESPAWSKVGAMTLEDFAKIAVKYNIFLQYRDIAPNVEKFTEVLFQERFCWAMEKAGGTGAWKYWRNQTILHVVNSVAPNNLRFSSVPRPEQLPEIDF